MAGRAKLGGFTVMSDVLSTLGMESATWYAG